MSGTVKKISRSIKVGVRRYPLVLFACLLSLGLVGGSLVFKAKVHHTDGTAGFDTSLVLPQPAVPKSGGNTVFSADSIKQHDGKGGHDCYVAVKGTVYEIKDNQYWKEGGHTPSNNQAYCGADLTTVIGQSPHGESVLSGLPKVGTYQ